MPDKLTDKEIVNVLEIMVQIGDEICLASVVLDLINRTKANENHYRRKVQNQKEELKRLNEVVNRLQADCENYKQVAENQQKITLDRGFEIKELKAEIERLKKGWKADILLTQNTKVEAYKEFANEFGNMLWQMKTEYLQQGDTEYAYAIVIAHTKLAKLLKELVGEDNA